MNIAFPALVFFLLALPGLIFYFTYIGRLRQSEAAVISTGKFSIALVAAVIVSGILHVVWSSVAASIGLPVDLGAVLVLLGGPAVSGQSGPVVAAAVTSHPYQVMAYFLSIYVGAGLFGLAARRTVRRYQLDHRFRALRYSNEWHYIFNGESADRWAGNRRRKADMVLVSVVSDCAAGSFLYVGFLAHYELNNDSDLRWIMLAAPVFRRRMQDDLGDRLRSGDAEPPGEGTAIAGRESRGPLLDDRYYEISGDRFIIWSRDIRSLNVDYYFVDEDGAA